MLPAALRYNAGLIRANGVPFFTGDGSTDSAMLLDRHGNPISSSKVQRVDAIHRTDWQGRQLLSSAARTNYAVRSDVSDWNTANFIGCTKFAAAVDGPDGAPASGADFTVGSNGSFRDNPYAVTAGSTYTMQFWARLVSGSNEHLVFDVYEGVAANLIARSSYTADLLDGDWHEASLQFTVPSGVTSIRGYPGRSVSATANSSLAIACFGIYDKAGVHIATAGSARTLTDYTLSGSTVSFGEAPANDAVCDWAGVARR